jgi:hypothetical protein
MKTEAEVRVTMQKTKEHLWLLEAEKGNERSCYGLNVSTQIHVIEP